MEIPRMSAPTNPLPDRTGFENIYAGKAPWDIGKPQAPFVAVADRVVSPVLDAGCGTGENALFFAARGHQVTGVDFAEVAIQRARRKAAERGLSAQFLVGDALTLTPLADSQGRFATVLDCGLFHVFPDADRRRYIGSLARVIEPGGRLFLMCFSDRNPKATGRGACRARSCTRPSPTAGKSNRSNRSVSR
jgi:SAM-dependent methyltransferase